MTLRSTILDKKHSLIYISHVSRARQIHSVLRSENCSSVDYKWDYWISWLKSLLLVSRIERKNYILITDNALKKLIIFLITRINLKMLVNHDISLKLGLEDSCSGKHSLVTTIVFQWKKSVWLGYSRSFDRHLIDGLHLHCEVSANVLFRQYCWNHTFSQCKPFAYPLPMNGSLTERLQFTIRTYHTWWSFSDMTMYTSRLS